MKRDFISSLVGVGFFIYLDPAASQIFVAAGVSICVSIVTSVLIKTAAGSE